MRADQREFLSVLGHFYLQHGQVEKALTLLRASVVLAPDDLALLRMLSWPICVPAMPVARSTPPGATAPRVAMRAIPRRSI